MVSMLLIFGLLSGAATASDNISPEAGAVLKAMSDFLGQTKAFSADADIDFEVVSQSGQKFQLSSSGSILMNRPSNFYITKKGMVADMAFIYDGSTLTLYGKRINAYAQLKVDGNTDDAILAYEMETGAPAPGADLLLNNAYDIMSSVYWKECISVKPLWVDTHATTWHSGKPKPTGSCGSGTETCRCP